MKVAFYAPLKSPNHPVPSGDRTIARGLVDALEHGGCTVHLASDLRIYDKHGDAAVQDALRKDAAAEVARILALDASETWQAWVTYHCYYKAPDLIGPAVSKALGIPYVLIEATRARKRLTGPWANFAAVAEKACDHAKTIFYFTERDSEALFRDAPVGQDVRLLRPFLPATALPAESPRDGAMLAVGMMRPGDKLASFTLIAEAFRALKAPDWTCEIIGDGPARAEVEALFAEFGECVRFQGALDKDAVQAAYERASLLVWPGVNEAFGMVYLEAQAAGLPIVAQDRPGVCDVVSAPRVPLASGAAGLAARLDSLLSDTTLRNREGQDNRARIGADHLLPTAARSLVAALGAT